MAAKQAGTKAEKAEEAPFCPVCSSCCRLNALCVRGRVRSSTRCSSQTPDSQLTAADVAASLEPAACTASCRIKVH